MERCTSYFPWVMKISVFYIRSSHFTLESKYSKLTRHPPTGSQAESATPWNWRLITSTNDKGVWTYTLVSLEHLENGGGVGSSPGLSNGVVSTFCSYLKSKRKVIK